MGDTDIESFIAQQKAKLAVERQTLNDDNSGSVQTRNPINNHVQGDAAGRERQKWARYDPGNLPEPAEQRQETNRVVTPTDRGLPLTNRNQEERQRALALERQREYNALLERKSHQQKGRSNPPPAARPGLDVGRYEDERKLLDKERQLEYNSFLEQKRALATSKLSQYDRPAEKQPDQREAIKPDAGKFDYQEQRRQLAEERRREYNQLLQEKANTKSRQAEPEIDNPSIIPFNRAEQERLKTKILEEERQKEYNETMAKIQERPKKREVTPVPNFDPSSQEQERRRQKEWEQREYKALLDKQQADRKQMMLLQQGVPYERISQMREEPKPGPADIVSHLPPRPDVNERANREPYRVPSDAFERTQPPRRDNQVQFDLGLNAKYSPAPTAFSRQRNHAEDNTNNNFPQSLYPDRKDPPPDPRQPRPYQEQQLDQFSSLGFGQYEERQKRLRMERQREMQNYFSLTGSPTQDKMNAAEYRQQWQQFHAGEKGLQLSPIEPTSQRIRPQLVKAVERDKYLQEWYDLRRKHHLPIQPGGQQRKQWGAPEDVKLSPRGTLDTDVIIDKVQRRNDRQEYEQQWRKYHGDKQTPRGGNAAMPGTDRLDTNRVISNVLKDNRGPEDTRRRRADADSGLKMLNPSNAVNPTMSKDEYRQEWEARRTQQAPYALDTNGHQDASDAIGQSMARAHREVNDYRQRWQEVHGGQTPRDPLPGLRRHPERKHFNQSSLQRSQSFHQEQKARVKQEEKKDLVDFLTKLAASPRLAHPDSSPYPTSADYRKHLARVRNDEYNRLLSKRQEVDSTRNRRWDTPVDASQERVLPLGGAGESRHQQAEEQRRRDWLEHMAKSQPNPIQYYETRREGRETVLTYRDKHQHPEQHQDVAFPLGGYALIRKKLNEERRRDYNEMLANQAQLSPRSQNVKGGSQGVGLLIKDDGRREGRLKKMEEDRNKEYNDFLANKRGNNASLKDQTDEFKAGTLPGNESDSVKWQKRKERNDEYNAFLANKNQRNRFGDKRQGPPENVSSLPRLNYSTSATKRQREEERNREYNEMLQQKAQGGGRARGAPPADVRTGWGTPDYNDILAKQRAKEQNFRRANDIAYETDPVVRQTESISRALDRDYEATKKAHARERMYNKQGEGLLENPDWLRPYNHPDHPNYPYYNQYYYDKRHPYSHRWHPNYRYYDYWTNQNGPPSVRRSKDQGGEYFASLPLGYNYNQPVLFNGRNTDSAQQRQKNRYGNELKQQMAEAAQARQIERKEGLLVNNNSVAAPVVSRPAVGAKGDPYYPYLKNLPDYDELSPRSNAILGRRQPTSERLRNKGGLNPSLTPRDKGADPGILDLGIFNQPRNTNLDPPAGLVYQPSTFITANSVPQLNSSVDEAYSFYASANPLDPNLKPDYNQANAYQPPSASGNSYAYEYFTPNYNRPFTSSNSRTHIMENVRNDDGPFNIINHDGPSTQCNSRPLAMNSNGIFPPFDVGSYTPHNLGPTLQNRTTCDTYLPPTPMNLNIPGKMTMSQWDTSDVAPVDRGGGQRDVPSLNLAGLGGEQAGAGSRVRFQDPRVPAQGMQFSTEDDRKKDKKQNVSEYRAELERQMAENNAKKQRARQERERYELKMEEEAKYYDPFGKGGGGAPMRDGQGNVVSDLRQMRNDNIQQLSHRDTRPPPRVELPPSFTLDKSPRGGPSSYRDDLIGPPPVQTTADGDTSHARGGHGIFGMPKTDVEKMQADKYKLDLKRQMEEKKAEEYRKKQLEKLQEEKEQKILEEQRAKIQREYEEEQRRNNEKQEEARRKNEELMRAAEDKKRELERQRKEEEERRQEGIRQQRERELQERQREEEAKRGKSPPIPALRAQGATQPAKKDEEVEEKEDVESRPEPGVRSPPVPGARAARTPVVESRTDHSPYNRAQSADVLNQLTRLRVELRKESDRVQTMLHDQEDDVQIYDPRHIQRPPPAPVVSYKPEVDVFDTAVNRRNPVAVRRTPNAPNERANSRAVEDFNALKHKTDTDSRKQFRELYPGEPTSSDALEAQQAALLKHQEERLQYLKDRRALEDTSGLRVAGPGRETHSSSSQLVSNSAFVEVNGIGHFPDDFEDIPRRNDSARYRRRSRIPSSPQIERIPSPDFNSRNTFGSQTSLNVDKMARKNEDRLRKLRDLQGDDLSLYDPEDVLDRFMSKQGHNRPPSRNTLLDDTWMRAASTNNRY